MQELPRAWKEEFARAAAERREDLLYQERMAQLSIRVRQQQEIDKLKQERRDAESWAYLQAVLATSQDIAAFRGKLDTYDTRTVEALMENEEALKAVRERIDGMLAEAHVLPDGRRVFKTRDGRRVFDEHGTELSADVIDPAAIDDKRPRWERFQAETETGTRLEAERRDLLGYQQKLDDARERLDAGDIAKEELDRIEADLAAAMPDAVRAKLGKDQPKPKEAALPEPTTTAALPSDMDDLMRQSGLGPTSATAAPAPR